MSALGWETHHRLWILGLGFVVVVAAAALAVWFFLLRSTGTPFDLRQALRLYRHDPGAAAAGDNRDLPPGGVYRYRTDGDESLSVGGIHRGFPALTEMVVSTGQRCATVTWEPLEQHIERMALCRSASGAFVMTSASTVEAIAGVSTTQMITCPSTAAVVPAKPRAGERWHATCTTSGHPVGLTGVVVGTPSVRVGDLDVPTVHTRVTLDFRGPTTGPSPADYWVADDGLIVRQQETVDVRQPGGPLGAVTYHEQADLALASVAPSR